MQHENVITWMTPAPITVPPDESVLKAYEKMKIHHIRRLPVVDEGKLVGIITITDVRSIISLDTKSILEHNDLLMQRKVASVMTSNPITIAPGENVGEAARLMMKHKVGGLPVVENKKLVGVISEADIFRLVIAESWHPQTMIKTEVDGVEIIKLSNGKMIHIRPIRPGDAIGLQASLVQMSPQTIYDRFMGYKNVMLDDEARYLTSLDYDRHMALIATVISNDIESIIGIARYHVLDNESNSAEFAIVVSDLYQRQGLGTHLMKRLMEYAQVHGIDIFLGFTHAENARLLRFVQRSKLPIERKFKDGIWELRVNLKGKPFPETNE